MLYHYDAPDTLELKRYIVNHYDAHADDVQLMIEHEHAASLDYLCQLQDRRRNKKASSDAMAKALANIRGWLTEHRITPTPSNIACDRIASVYFRMIEVKA